MKRESLLVISCLTGLSSIAAVVHVVEQTEADGQVVQISDRSLITGMPWTTQTAPTKSGYIFTHWTISTAQDFVAQDEWGRAFDVATFKLYEDTTLTAHYLPESQDEDGDGLADGHEIYWYGNLDQGPTSDTDGDGFTFSVELANGTNPLMADADVEGPVRYADGELLQYNPYNMVSCIFRSEPEGVLFTTKSDIVKAGTYLTTEPLGAFSSGTAKFAYWMVDGVAQRDEWGRAIDLIAFNMPTVAVEVVAVTADNEETRRKLYWYGRTDVSMESDTDGDGFTFAEELANGTNPLMADADVEGPVRYADGKLLQYNPWNMHAYTIRSEPEGALFETVTEYVRAGMMVEPNVYTPSDSTFAYWTKNGMALRDEWGRALDSAAFQMPTDTVEVVAVSVADAETRQKLYWYGRTDVAMESDTDGDRLTFAEELANGTNPLMAETDIEGPVRYADSELHEVNLQPFEQVKGTVVDDEYAELFYSPIAGNAATSKTFDGAVTPVVVDLDDDGRFDLVVESVGGKRTVYLNVGSVGNPQFAETPWNGAWLGKVTAAKVTSIEGLTLDVQPVGANGYSFADVDGDGVQDLLVSDVEGRIWFYKGSGALGTTSPTEFVLQHKVWGGSFAGFANGLTIAAVDWDDDGDVDLVCGTADRKLMLLNDPRIGRPVNVRAEPGATSVVLTWDPNVNSRVRGYGIYRGVDSNTYDQVQSLWPLPRYRDEPQTVQDYFYRVTGMSRFYTAGNSTPIISESQPTDAVFVKFAPSMWLNDTSSFTETNVEMVVSINNSMGIAANGFRMTFAYDPAVLEPVEVKTTGLTEGVTFGEVKVKGEGEQWNWQISATGGAIKTGSGAFLRLVFRVKPWCGVARTEVALNAVTAKTLAGNPINFELPKVGVIEIAERKYDPAVMSVSVGSVKVDTCTDFEVPVTVIASEKVTNFVAKVSFDEEALELRGISGGQILTSGEDTASPLKSVTIVSAGEDFVLKFYAKDQHAVSATEIVLSEIGANDIHGYAITAEDAKGTVLIHDAHPLVPAVVSISTEDRKVDTLEEVTIPFRVTSSETLKSGVFTIEYDSDILQYVPDVSANGRIQVEANDDFELTFFAKDQHRVSKTEVILTTASVVDVNDFTVVPSTPVAANVLIHDAHPLVPAQVTMTLGDVATKTETDFEMTLLISTTEALQSLAMEMDYDHALLTFLSGELTFSDGVPSSVTYRFHAQENHTVDKTTVTIRPKSGVDHNGLTAVLPEAVSGVVVLADSNPWQPATVSLSMTGAKVDTLTEFEVPVRVTSNEKLTNLVATVEFDEKVLELRGANGASLRRVGDNAPYQVVGAGDDFVLKFLAKDQHDVTKTTVGLSDITAVDEHGLVANPIVDAEAEIVIHDAHPLVPAEVTMTLGDVVAKTEADFEMTLSISTTEALQSLAMEMDYDTSLLTFLSGELAFSDGVPSSVTYRFRAKENHTVDKTTVTIRPKSGVDHNGLAAVLPESVSGTVVLADSNPWQPATVSLSMTGAKVDTLTEFAVPVKVTSNEKLTNLVATVEFDEKVLELRGANGASLRRAGDSTPYQVVGAGDDFVLKFFAKDQHDVTKTTVGLSGVTAVDEHGLVANPIADAEAGIVIHDAHPLVPAQVTMTLGDVAAKTETDFEMALSISTTEALQSLAMEMDYDTSLLTFLGGELAFSDGVPSSVTYRFRAKENHTVDKTTVTIRPKSGVDHNGLAAVLPESVSGTVVLADSNPWQPATVSLSMAGAKVDTLTEFEVPVRVTSNEKLTNLVATVEFDEKVLELRGVNGASLRRVGDSAPYQVVGAGDDFVLKFFAKDQHDVTKTTVGLSGVTAVDEHGLVANPIADAEAGIVIHDANPPIPAEVAVKVADAEADTRTEFSVAVSVTTTKPLTKLVVTVGFDENVLELRGIVGASMRRVGDNAPYQVESTGGGFELLFFAKEQHDIKKTVVSLSDGAATCTEGLAANVTLTGGTVLLVDSNPPVAPKMEISIIAAPAESGKAFSVPLGTLSDGDLAYVTATIQWDSTLLSFVDAPGASAVETVSANSRRIAFPATGEDNRYLLNFTAQKISALRTSSWVSLTAAGGTGANGLAAQLVTGLPLTANVLIVRTINKYDPGDLNGDGRFTNADLDMLKNYFTYLELVKALGANHAAVKAKASYNLTGRAKTAADVNCDGKVDANDISMLTQFIISSEEAAK